MSFHTVEPTADGHKKNPQTPAEKSQEQQPRQFAKSFGKNNFGKSMGRENFGKSMHGQAPTLHERFGNSGKEHKSDKGKVFEEQNDGSWKEVAQNNHVVDTYKYQDGSVQYYNKARGEMSDKSDSQELNQEVEALGWGNDQEPGENLEEPEAKSLENASLGDKVLLPNGTIAIMMDEVEVLGTREDPLGLSIDREVNSTINGELELKKIVVLKTVEESGKVGSALAEVIEKDRVTEGYATSRRGKISRFPTEQRQIKFYGADGTEEIITVTQARNSGNFIKGDDNVGMARTGETKFTKYLKGFAEVTGLAGDFLDLATALKGLAEGEIDAVLATAPFMGPIFAGINAQSDEVLRDLHFRKFNSLLFNGSHEDFGEFLEKNQEFGLELIYLSENQIDAVKSGEKINKFDIDVFQDSGKIPTIIDLWSDIINIHATIHN